MAEAKKFLFDNSFDEPSSRGDAAVEQARLEAYEEGRAAGRAEAEAASERMAADAMQAVATKLGEIEATREELEGVLSAHAVQAAVAMMRKIVPGLVGRSGVEEVEALMRECMEGLLDEPRVVVRVAESVLDPLQERVARVKADAGYTGEVVLLSDQAMSPSDCRVEWANGGAERAGEAIWKDIEANVSRWLAQGS